MESQAARIDTPWVELVGMKLVVVPRPGLILALLPKLRSVFEAGDCLRLPIVNVKLAEVGK